MWPGAEITQAGIDLWHGRISRDQQEDDRLILAPAFLAWLEREPRLSAIILAAEEELRAEEQLISDKLGEIQKSLRSAWEEKGERVRSIVATVGAGGARDSYWPLDRFDEGLTTPFRFELRPPIRRQVPDCGEVAKLYQAAHHWATWANQTEEGSGSELASELGKIETRIHFVQERIGIASVSLLGVSIGQLRRLAHMVNPPPDFDPEDAKAFSRFRFDKDVAGEVFRGKVPKLSPNQTQQRSQEFIELAERLSFQLKLVLSGVLSRVGLLSRFAARCESFDRERLLEVASISGEPEQTLTLEAARYFFDQGLNVVLNPRYGNAVPDLTADSAPSYFYVEAKQYESAPRGMIKKAVNQVYETWSKLESHHNVPEAFLLVFRRAGPLLVPKTQRVSHRGRTLHVLVVDLAATTPSKSRTKPVALSAEMLLPALMGDA